MFDHNIAPEKVSNLIPESYRTSQNARALIDYELPNRTTFYAQLEDEGANPNKVGAEKVSVLQTKLSRSHTTYFDKKNGLWREDTLVEQTPASQDPSIVNGPPEKISYPLDTPHAKTHTTYYPQRQANL